MRTIIIILACAASVYGADLTITIPTADVPRVQEAYGSILNLGRPATTVEMQNAITAWIHQSTTDYERRKNMVTYSPPPMQMAVPSPTVGGLKAAPTAAPKKKK